VDVETTTEEPSALVRRLENEGVETLAVCGGAAIYDMFLRAGVVDEVYATIEPVLFGEGVKLLSDELSVQLELLNIDRPNDSTLFLHYRVLSSASLRQ
jgi:riboflavin biosynthesis pyrimidine reductase